jgi:nucleotide-binding universal stress UspA family protein
MTADTAKDQGPFRLLVGLTLTEEGRHAFEDAVRIARRIPGCVLHVVHVASAPDGAKDPAIQSAIIRVRVDQMVEAVGGAAGVKIVVDLRCGDPAKALTTFAHDIAADLVLLGSDRGHRASWERDPTVDRLGDAVACPIVVTAGRRTSRGTFEGERTPSD